MSANQPPPPEGTILRQLRLQQGLRVNELARRANVSSATITLLEQGARRASPALLSRLSTALHVEASLLSGIAASSPDAPPGTREPRHERRPAAPPGIASSRSPGGSAWQRRSHAAH